MKKLTLLFFIFFSIFFIDEIHAKDEKITQNGNYLNCTFNFSKYAAEDLKYDEWTLLRYLSNVKINIDFFSNSKSNWTVKNIYFPENFKDNVKNTLEEEKDIWYKIVYEKKLTQYELKLAKLILKEFDTSLSEVIKEVRKSSKIEKEEFIKSINSSYEDLLKVYLEDVGESIIKNQKSYFQEIIKMFENNKEIIVNDNIILIKLVTDYGMIYESTINYSKVLDQISENAILMKLIFLDGTFLRFDSLCENNQITALSNQIKSNDKIEERLRKIKSFFEDGLITQEEYDKKRKEILDEL